MEKITYQKVYDSQGAFVALELHQGDQHITIGLGSTQLDVKRDSPKWENVKPIVEKFQKEIKEYAEKAVSNEEK